MAPPFDSTKIDHAAVAAALEGLRDRGSRCQAYLRADGTNLCVDAVHAGRCSPSRYSESASRRAVIGGRRLLPVVGSGDIDGRLWIAYDIGSATSLADHRRRGPMPTAASLQVLSDVARALDGAAAAGVLAFELLPGSVFLTAKGARVGDLGTAREGLAGAKFELQGDPAFVPPEALKARSAGERSGVYLYGTLLHYLLTGAAPARGLAEPPPSGPGDLPMSIKAIVATATADDPESRPRSASDAHEMARRALRGARPARARAPRMAAARRRMPAAVAAKAALSKGAAPGRAVRQQVAATANTHRGAVFAACALVLGAVAGLLLGTAPDSQPARAQTVTSGGLSVTLPSGWHHHDPGRPVLSVRAPGSRLRARIVDRSLPQWPEARPVRLGPLQAWRRPSGAVVRYSIPTSRGTLVVTCRMTGSGSPQSLRLCERTASTLRVRHARALPLAAAAEESRSLRTAITALKTERDAARVKLAGASTADDQRAAAEELADSHERVAAALRELDGAEAIEVAARDVAEAYANLAASAESGSAGGWDEASEQLRRNDALLAEAIAAAG